MEKKKKIGVIFAFAAVILMIYTEKNLAPSYWIKSGFKIAFFIGAIFAYSLMSGESFAEIIGFNRNKLPKKLLLLMGGAYAAIIALFFLLRGFIDTDSIRDSLMTKEQLTKENCLFVFAYIMICNSFLEEAFFRGFTFNLFSEKIKVGYVISGILFAVYHIGIVDSWFSPIILALCIAGLAAVGMFLQYVSQKCKTIKGSWLIHGCANLAINTIGAFLIFGL